MLLRCDQCREQLLDHLYGLLDPAEAVALDDHLVGCPACTAAREEAGRWQGLLSRAAKSETTDIRFVAPTEEPTEPRRQPAEGPRHTVRRAWVTWVVAASLFLMAAGLAGPAVRDSIGYAVYKPRVLREVATVTESQKERNMAFAALDAERRKVNERIARLQEEHDQIREDWGKSADVAVSLPKSQPFAVTVKGPATAVPGAPNEYTLGVADAQKRARAVAFEAVVKDTAGKTLFAKKFEPKDRSATPEQTLRLPAAMWDGLTPGSELFLHVTASDAESKQSARMTEAIRLLEPVYTTMLVTDRPMYRPGETMYFRSVTLDRTRFLPPTREMNLRFELKGPNGQQVALQPDVVGLAKPVTVVNGQQSFVVGPDGQPVRGVGTGAFVLATNQPGGRVAPLPGGRYTLEVYEIALNSRLALTNAKPLATRTVLINDYVPDQLEKKLEFDAATYGPGDAVQVKFELRDQGQPVPKATLSGVTVTVDGKRVQPDVAPSETDAAGNAAIRFTLPRDEDLRAATVAVEVMFRGLIETIVRPVPVASRKLHVEFFPEGGDLVAGLPGRVYFRATTAAGKPADVSGVLTDGTNVVCEIKTLTDPDRPGANQGLGVFEFTPQAGKRYAVRLNRPVGAVQLAAPFAGALGVAAAQPLPAFDLPPVKADGVVMAVRTGVTRTGEKIHVELRATGPKRNVLVGAYTRGRPVAQQKATLEAGKVTELDLDLGDTKLGGVTRVTVFEVPEAVESGASDLKPVAERLVFRQPGESLKLTVTPTTSGAFVPGSPVELRVTATDEAGNPKPAVLWAAVVNNSVVTMADETTARSLPTHFLLGGEVQKPEDLENADFLLTDHPQAKAALDLLLGTQGWRRFAETRLFQKLAPTPDAARLTASLTGGGAEWRSDVKRVFDEFWPRYERAVFDLDTAEAELRSGKAIADPQAAANRADQDYQGKQTVLGAAAADLQIFDEGMQERKAWLPGTVIVVFGMAFVCLAAFLTRRRGAAERGPLKVGVVGFALLGAFLLLTVGLTGLGDDGRWRAVAEGAPQPERYGWTGMKTSTPGGGVAQAGIEARQPLPVVMPIRKSPSKAILPPLPKREVRVQQLPQVFQQPSPATLRVNSDYWKRKNAGKNPDADPGFLKLAREVPQTPPLVVREYAHARPTPQPGVAQPRSDFTDTVFWHPVLVLPEDGQTTLRFDLSDSINAYRVLVAGHTLDGRLGSTTTLLEVRKPVAVDAKLPPEIGAADKLDVPVVVTNNTPESQSVTTTLVLDGLKADGEDAAGFKLDVDPNSGSRRAVRLTPAVAEGKATVRAFGVASPTLSDSVMRSVTVVPDGFPAQGGASDVLEERARFPITLPPQWNKGSMRATVTVYPNALAEVQAGLAGLLREPSGCFEQTSTANYPNVLILDYLRETNQTNPDAARRARELLDRGYGRLTGYECPKTGSETRLGYEWFGSPDRPHEALTAYGLLQFTDMARVFPVDGEMLRRTKQFLLDSRDGAGGFKRNSRALDQFGRAPEHVTNAYIVWAITEAERGTSDPSDLSKELNALVVLAKDGRPAKDPYFLSLVGNALLNRGRQADGVALLKQVAAMQTDGRVTGAETSITASSGRSLDIETTAFAVLGWLKVDRPETFAKETHDALRWIKAQRDGGGSFGATQSTILALKALLEYARKNKRPAESGTVRVFVGAFEVAKRDFSSGASGPVVVEIPDADGTFKPGPTEIRVETTAKQPYPVSVAWSCRTRQPASSDACAVKLTANLAGAEVPEGSPVRLDVALENLTDRGHGMAVAIVGLPAGLKLPEDAKELKALCECPAEGEPVVSFWEVRGRELVLYWRGLAPRQRVEVKLTLIAHAPGEFRGPASRAYLYYDPDHKHWVEPTDIRVRAK